MRIARENSTGHRTAEAWVTGGSTRGVKSVGGIGCEDDSLLLREGGLKCPSDDLLTLNKGKLKICVNRCGMVLSLCEGWCHFHFLSLPETYRGIVN